jgi:hypothetical protein
MPAADDPLIIAEIRATSARLESHASDLLRAVHLLNLFIARPAEPAPAGNDNPDPGQTS